MYILISLVIYWDEIKFYKVLKLLTFFDYVIIPINMHWFHIDEWKSLKAFKFLYKNMLVSILFFSFSLFLLGMGSLNER